MPFNWHKAHVATILDRHKDNLDLDYLEDKDAEVDANIVMTGSGKYVEVQSSGEEATYSEDQLNALIALGRHGIEILTEIQKEAICVNSTQPTDSQGQGADGQCRFLD
mgnify:CR=1 FL=1